MPEELRYFTTDQPDLIFEDTAVGRLKKELWEADDEKIDAILAEYGLPSPCEWAKPGSYIQTTVRHDLVENRRRNDIVFIPVGSTELHGDHTVDILRCWIEANGPGSEFHSSDCSKFGEEF